jgi:hypothetical protein
MGRAESTNARGLRQLSGTPQRASPAHEIADCARFGAGRRTQCRARSRANRLMGRENAGGVAASTVVDKRGATQAGRREKKVIHTPKLHACTEEGRDRTATHRRARSGAARRAGEAGR